MMHLCVCYICVYMYTYVYKYVYKIHTWHQTRGDVLCLTVSLLYLELEFIPLNSIQQQQTQDRQRLPPWCVGKGTIQNIIWQRFAQKLE